MWQARPGEIYEDSRGRQWLVRRRYDEPTIEVQQVQPVNGVPTTLFGGVTGSLWDGFQKIADDRD